MKLGKSVLRLLNLASLTIVSGLYSGCVRNTGATPWTHLNFQNDSDDFQFAIVPDRTGGDCRSAFTNALEKVNRMHPEFVMTVGDLVEGMSMEDVNARKSVTEVLRAQQRELSDMTAKVTAPFFTVVGNHDINRSRPYPSCFARANEESSAVWKEFHGNDTYYSFVYKKVLFVCLNTMEGRVHGGKQVGITEKQYAWFKKTLDANSDVRWTFVFMHQPKEWLTDSWLKFEKEELLKRKYTVFAGDWHTYLHVKRHNRDYYVLSVAGGGSCMNGSLSKTMSARLKGSEYGEMDHITWVTMTPEGPDVVNLLLDGMLPGDYLNQRTSLSSKYSEALDYPTDKETAERLLQIKMKNDAASNVRTVKASTFGWNAIDSTDALQRAIDSGAQKVIVDWLEEGDWVISPVLLRVSNQEIVISDGVTVRCKNNEAMSAKAPGLFTVPEGVTNVALRGIVTATIAVDNGTAKHAVAVMGGCGVTIGDLTVVTDGMDAVKVGEKAKNVNIENITSKAKSRKLGK